MRLAVEELTFAVAETWIPKQSRTETVLDKDAASISSGLPFSAECWLSTASEAGGLVPPEQKQQQQTWRCELRFGSGLLTSTSRQLAASMAAIYGTIAEAAHGYSQPLPRRTLRNESGGRQPYLASIELRLPQGADVCVALGTTSSSLRPSGPFLVT